MHRMSWGTLATAVLVGACGGGQAPESDTVQAVRGVTDTEIVLGTHTDLSGSIAILGVDGANGTRRRRGNVLAQFLQGFSHHRPPLIG